MAFYGIYGKYENRYKLEVKEALKNDIRLIEQWIEFDKKNPPTIEFPSERCNYLLWDFALRNKASFEGIFFRVVSFVHEMERLEGIISISLNDGETIIEALEVAPWNRESYLGDEREFRNLGLILIGQAIMYGKFNNSCGKIRLESLGARVPYYRDGLGMHEISSGIFIFDDKECDDFVDLLVKYEMLK